MECETQGSNQRGPDMAVDNLEDARAVIRELRERYRAQSHQLLAWRRRVRAQEEQMARLNRERAEQLKLLSSQLLLFESRLCRKQKDVGALLAQREAVIERQQRCIEALQARLADAGLDPPHAEAGLDSLDDSDSAVVLDCEHEVPRDAPDAATLARSVSDAVEPGSKYSLRRSNGFLRRPEVLETVYSVEEDEPDRPDRTDRTDEPSSGRLHALCGSFERLNETRPTAARQPEREVTTYNRVMSNHRSVTKPKDVKYKRINKAKSKSLEELRGRLRNWVDKGNKLAISLDQSCA
ncbi:uncharacterized protein LOC134542124 [Bacillus rossius redtenbacheri]|uniref:uncharacterized protein LOC134542124 n=1 Tax=Bacillus rossius redtenbacheri TaxID=93214 RepID=UPI002FDE655A